MQLRCTYPMYSFWQGTIIRRRLNTHHNLRTHIPSHTYNHKQTTKPIKMNKLCKHIALIAMVALFASHTTSARVLLEMHEPAGAVVAGAVKPQPARAAAAGAVKPQPARPAAAAAVKPQPAVAAVAGAVKPQPADAVFKNSNLHS